MIISLLALHVLIAMFFECCNGVISNFGPINFNLISNFHLSQITKNFIIGKYW